MFKPASLNFWLCLFIICSLIISVLCSGCGMTTTFLITAYVNSWQYFSTPNYPHPYESGIDNCWLIRAADEDQVILLDTYSFELQSSVESCHNGDYVEIRDGTHAEAPLLDTLCGSTFRNITGTSAFMFVHFHTDTDTITTHKGFIMRYRAVSPPNSNGAPAPSPSPTPVWATDSGCSKVIYVEVTSVVEELTSVGYPIPYPRNSDQCWQFHSPVDFTVQISIMLLDTEYASDCTTADYLDIRDGPSLSNKRLALLCGDASGIQLEGDTYLLVRFRTNSLDGRHKGFKIAYWGEYVGESHFSVTVRIIIACIVISLIISIFLTLKKSKGIFVRKRTVNVTSGSLPVAARPRGQLCGRHGAVQIDRCAHSHRLLSYTPAAPPYCANVYPPPPPGYAPSAEEDPIYPAEFLEYPGGGFPLSPVTPPPPYEEISHNKHVENGATPTGGDNQGTANGSVVNPRAKDRSSSSIPEESEPQVTNTDHSLDADPSQDLERY